MFSYNLEDIDHLESGADIYNGQESVMWCNLRDAFGSELKAMYQSLRSTGAWSYDKVETAFEAHQKKWGEAIFNEDAWFKYLQPLVEQGTGAYLAMLQGSKEEQRKWWLYNRFRYLDSKYNAGDALSDVIQLRGYAKADVSVTPYADIYAAVKYGSYLVQTRAERNKSYTLTCPLDNVNDTEIYIYSSSQIAAVGDLSGLKVGFADFSNATKIQNIKIGDSDSSYSNGNLNELYLGNNVLLRTLDVRNCPNLGQGDMKSVDISGCSNIEHVYFDGTTITGLSLPNGGILKTLHLPETVTNLTIRNQTAITDFTMPSYANISTLWLENVSSVIDEIEILKAIPANARVRLIGFMMEADDAAEIDEIYTLFDSMRGLDEYGNNMDSIQVSGTIHTASLTGAEIAAYNERYPYVTVTADHTTSYLYYYNYDGSSLLYTEAVYDGGDGGTYTGTPSRSSTAQYTYAFVGWSKTANSTRADSDFAKNVVADRKVYAAYTATVRKYTVYFYNGSTLLQTVSNVAYGSSATYTGSTPVSTEGSADDYPFEGWSPSPSNIQGNTSCYAVFGSPLQVAEITDSWDEIIAAVNDGTYKSKYKIGNYKALDLGSEGTVNMQIVAKDKEALADGSGNAPLSWLSMELLSTSHRMNPTLVDAQATKVYDPTASYIWTADETTANKYQSSNQGKGSTTSWGGWEITPSASGTLTVNWTVDSESASYDYLNIWYDGTSKTGNKGGSNQSGSFTISLTAGTKIQVFASYTKDSSGDKGTDTATVTFTADASVSVAAITESVTVQEAQPAQEGTGTIGGWEKSEMRTYLKGTVKPLIPSNVQSAIKNVSKTQPAYNTSKSQFTQTTSDDVWIPSYSEMFDSSSIYMTVFQNTNANRIKKKAGASSASWWWLRSASGSNSFYDVYSSGASSSGIAYSSGAVALGFCL